MGLLRKTETTPQSSRTGASTHANDYRGGAEQNTMTVVMMPSEFVSMAFGDMKPREIKKD